MKDEHDARKDRIEDEMIERAVFQSELELKRMIKDAVPVLNAALNYFYPSKACDGEKAADARQALFELRDRMEKIK